MLAKKHYFTMGIALIKNNEETNKNEQKLHFEHKIFN